MSIKTTTCALFSESNTRFLVEVTPKHAAQFETLMSGVPVSWLGLVQPSDSVVIRGTAGGAPVVNLPLADVLQAWQRPLAWE
jgi:phosphoribosylformylglycinamidine synthase